MNLNPLVTVVMRFLKDLGWVIGLIAIFILAVLYGEWLFGRMGGLGVALGVGVWLAVALLFFIARSLDKLLDGLGFKDPFRGGINSALGTLVKEITDPYGEVYQAIADIRRDVADIRDKLREEGENSV